MTEADRPAFLAMWTRLADRYGRALTAELLEFDFAALGHLTLTEVSMGVNAHVRHPTDCRFFPMPGQISAHVASADGCDGRLGAEEAWSLALQARDERASVVWTQEMAEAWGVARVVYEQGDEVGARMAFREAYIARVQRAREAREPVRWLLCQGWDHEGRAEAVRQASALGRHVHGAEHLLALPGPRSPAALLEGSGAALPKGLPPAGRAALERCRALLAAARQAHHEPPEAEQNRTSAARARAAAAAARLAHEEGLDLETGQRLTTGAKS